MQKLLNHIDLFNISGGGAFVLIPDLLPCNPTPRQLATRGQLSSLKLTNLNFTIT